MKKPIMQKLFVPLVILGLSVGTMAYGFTLVKPGFIEKRVLFPFFRKSIDYQQVDLQDIKPGTDLYRISYGENGYSGTQNSPGTPGIGGYADGGNSGPGALEQGGGPNLGADADGGKLGPGALAEGGQPGVGALAEGGKSEVGTHAISAKPGMGALVDGAPKNLNNTGAAVYAMRHYNAAGNSGLPAGAGAMASSSQLLRTNGMTTQGQAGQTGNCGGCAKLGGQGHLVNQGNSLPQGKGGQGALVVGVGTGAKGMPQSNQQMVLKGGTQGAPSGLIPLLGSRGAQQGGSTQTQSVAPHEVKTNGPALNFQTGPAMQH